MVTHGRPEGSLATHGGLSGAVPGDLLDPARLGAEGGRYHSGGSRGIGPVRDTRAASGAGKTLGRLASVPRFGATSRKALHDVPVRIARTHANRKTDQVLERSLVSRLSLMMGVGRKANPSTKQLDVTRRFASAHEAP